MSSRPPSCRANRRQSAKPKPTPGAVTAASSACFAKRSRAVRTARVRKTWAVVADGQFHVTGSGAHFPVNPSIVCLVRILSTVVDQVEHDLLDHAHVGGQFIVTHAIGHGHEQLHVCLLGALGQSALEAFDQLVDRHALVPLHPPCPVLSGRRTTRFRPSG